MPNPPHLEHTMPLPKLLTKRHCALHLHCLRVSIAWVPIALFQKATSPGLHISY